MFLLKKKYTAFMVSIVLFSFLRKSKDSKTLNQDDMLILNKAISKLFSHLEIEKTGNDPGTPRGQGLKVKGQTIGATGGKQTTKQLTKHEIEDAKELLLKLKKFEQELQKKRLQEQEDMQRSGIKEFSFS